MSDGSQKGERKVSGRVGFGCFAIEERGGGERRIGGRRARLNRTFMSAKWRRSQAWDHANIPGWAWPVKLVLRAFSSIWLAVALLTIVALYGVVASVPIGMLAKIPTYGVYALTLLGAIAAAGGLPAAAVWVALRKSAAPARFVAGFAVLGAGSIAGVWAWARYAWPALHYDPATGRGLMLWAEFVSRTSAITVRRLPGLEMSELEFYGWWPLRVVLLLFVVNMIVATVRRIEFNFKNLGVLTVHTGIVTIALGSVYYNGLKQEGDTILRAGPPDEKTGVLSQGPAQRYFYDNTRVSLYVRQTAPQFREAEQRPLSGVPRYNDYNLAAVAGESAWDTAKVKRPWETGEARELSVPVIASPLGRVDPDIGLRLVGYASYAEGRRDWIRVDPKTMTALAPGERLRPLRMVELISEVPDDEGKLPDGPVFVYTLAPTAPKERSSVHPMLAVEYTLGGGGPAKGAGSGGMPETRWRDLAEPLPPNSLHGLVIEVPTATGVVRRVAGVRAGDRIEFEAAGGKWVVEVSQIEAEPPFPIITEGYREASSSVAILKITPPEGSSVGGGTTFERWVYHRFPEISQDLLGELNDRGMPKRTDADPGIRVGLIEADRLNVYFDEPAEGVLRAIVREPGGNVSVFERVDGDIIKDVVPKISMRVGARWEHAIEVERPVPVPETQREREAIGTHEKAMLAVEVSVPGEGGGPGWRQVMWLPFTRYMSLGGDVSRVVNLPDGRRLELAWGRQQRRFPGFELRLSDFEMIAYDHRGSPRDYQSRVQVSPTGAADVNAEFSAYEHVTKLNEPLRAPFMWDEQRGLASNVAGSLARGISPLHFKLSQAGWDRNTWEQTQKMADAGEIAKPYVTFTILGVGNNPGIHIIALGGVLMGVGIPWAFYLKPWLVRREKRRIQAELAAGTYRRPGGGTQVAAGVAEVGGGLGGVGSGRESGARSEQGIVGASR